MFRRSAILTMSAMAALIGLGSALTGCGGSSHNNTPPPQPDIVQVAQSKPEFSILVEAVVAAKLVDTLKGPGPFTVFAPTDTAFANLLTDLKVTKAQLLADTALLTKVLTYHVLPSKVEKAQVPVGKAIKTVQGDIFKIDSIAPDLVITDSSNRTSKIIATDIQASNGVIHVIDKVLLPSSTNIVQTAQAVPRFSILVEAVVAADLATTLSGAGPFTVFAPNDTAFANLLTDLKVTKAQLLADKALLTKVLTYHVLGSRVLKAEVPVGAPITTLQTQTFTVDNTLTITDASARTSKIIATDILTSNGVIHEIDKVILPK